jgi:NADPH2:quinone reductase
MTQTHAMRIHQPGGPEAMRWESVDLPAPGPGEVLVENRAVGLNYIAVYYRTGHYKAPLPFVLGTEGVGVVEALGADVTGFARGDRVAYVNPIGAYAERLIRPAARLVKVPDAIDDVQAAGMMLKGMTAEYLLRRTHRVEAGETIVVHAAAGGVGQILCQWASSLGATVIGTVGSRAKADLARQAGCAHVIVMDEEDLVARVREITGGKGVPVVYDGIGADSFARSIDCLAPLGLMASFGSASGPVPPIDPLMLSNKGSLFFTRPTLAHYTATTEQLRGSAATLFHAVLKGDVTVRVNQTYALRDAASAHADLEARKLTGSTVLLV